MPSIGIWVVGKVREYNIYHPHCSVSFTSMSTLDFNKVTTKHTVKFELLIVFMLSNLNLLLKVGDYMQERMNY